MIQSGQTKGRPAAAAAAAAAAKWRPKHQRRALIQRAGMLCQFGGKHDLRAGNFFFGWAFGRMDMMRGRCTKRKSTVIVIPLGRYSIHHSFGNGVLALLTCDSLFFFPLFSWVAFWALSSTLDSSGYANTTEFTQIQWREFHRRPLLLAPLGNSVHRQVWNRVYQSACSSLVVQGGPWTRLSCA